MERHYDNEFEQFLKQNADQYRLYPSAKPWKGIHSHFHGNRRWFGLGAILLLLTGSLLTAIVVHSPKQNQVAKTNPAVKSIEQKDFTPSSSSTIANIKNRELITQSSDRTNTGFVGINFNEGREYVGASPVDHLLTPAQSLLF